MIHVAYVGHHPDGSRRPLGLAHEGPSWNANRSATIEACQAALMAGCPAVSIYVEMQIIPDAHLTLRHMRRAERKERKARP